MKLWWYLARAGGIVAWSLLAVSMLWGLVLSTRLFRSRPRPAWTLDIHRFLGGFSVLFTAIHAGALILDGYAHFGPAEVLVPLASRWHPVAVAWGVLALYLMLAIEGTSLAMKKMSNKAWKRVHRSAFLLFVFATIHGVAAGTDLRAGSGRWVVFGITVTIVFLYLVRVFAGKGRRAPAARHPAPPRASVTEPVPAESRRDPRSAGPSTLGMSSRGSQDALQEGRAVREEAR